MWAELEKILSFHPTYVCQSQLLPALEIAILPICWECKISGFFGGHNFNESKMAQFAPDSPQQLTVSTSREIIRGEGPTE